MNSESLDESVQMLKFTGQNFMMIPCQDSMRGNSIKPLDAAYHSKRQLPSLFHEKRTNLS